MGFVFGDCDFRGWLVERLEMLGYRGSDCVFFCVGREGFERFGCVCCRTEDVVVGCYVAGGWGWFLLWRQGYIACFWVDVSFRLEVNERACWSVADREYTSSALKRKCIHVSTLMTDDNENDSGTHLFPLPVKIPPMQPALPAKFKVRLRLQQRDLSYGAVDEGIIWF